MAKFLITSALPYVNGVKHLGNLAGSLLPADIHARFRRQTGHEVLFLCGTDEHGTPSELAAQAAGLPVAEYCARQHAIQADIYRRFGLSFDHFSRTSGVANRLLTQELFRHLDAAGHIEPRLIRQAYSATDRRFLPDRYVVGTCPHCGNPNARGDQCESCTRLLDPDDLVSPRSAISGATDVEFRETRHLFLKLSAFEGRLRRWIETRRDWPPLVRSIARNGSTKASRIVASRAISPGACRCPSRASKTRSSMSGSMRRSATSRRRSNGARRPGTRLAGLVAGRRWRALRAIPRQGQCALPRHKLSRDDSRLGSSAQAPGHHQGLQLAHLRGRQVLDQRPTRHIHGHGFDAASRRQLALVARRQRAGECRCRLYRRALRRRCEQGPGRHFRQSRQPLPGLRCRAIQFDGSRAPAMPERPRTSSPRSSRRA